MSLCYKLEISIWTPTKTILLPLNEDNGFIITSVNTSRKSQDYTREHDKDNKRRFPYKSGEEGKTNR